MKRLFLLLSVLAIWSVSLSMHAQCTGFRIYYAAGDVKQIDDMGNQVGIVRNKLINSGSIQLPDKAQVILYSDQNRPLVLTSPGSYSFEQLKHLCLNKELTFMEKYLTYLKEELTEKENPEGQRIHASIVRGRKIQPAFPPDSTNVLSGWNTFSWCRSTGRDEFFFNLFDSSKQLIITKRIFNDTTYACKLVLGSSLPERFFWCVRDVPGYSTDEPLNLVIVVDSLSVANQLLELQKEMCLEGISDEIQVLSLAGFLLERNLISQAYETIRNGIISHPDDMYLLKSLEALQENYFDDSIQLKTGSK
ncbi:MAG: hypothetical protein JXA23_06025 [Bacteroidales bacterium]|nr:hypothetical protein [Bacteroidales bacterium]